MIVIHHKEIKEVAAHLLGRIHEGVEIKLFLVGEVREYPGQHVRLDLGGDGQFGADPLFFRRNGLQVGHVFLQTVHKSANVVGQCARFVMGADHDLLIIQLGRIHVFLELLDKLIRPPADAGNRPGHTRVDEYNEDQNQQRHHAQ